jgi:thioredoxin
MATKQEFASFEELIAGSDLPVLIDFYAPWCGPCQMMAGFLVELSRETKGKLKIAKVNVDSYPALASQYDVSALPTVVLFKQGQPVHRIEGVMRTPQLLEQVNPFL